MNILDTIRGKIITVQQGVSNSILLPLSSSKKTVHSSSLSCSQAGDSYLSWCQKRWSEIHRESEHNALKAQEVNSLVSEVVDKLDRQNKAMSEFVAELTAFSDLTTNVNIVLNKMSLLSGLCGELESMLLELDDTCDQLQQHKNEQEHEIQFINYQQRKHVQLEQTKVKLARQHVTNVQQYEQQMSAVLKERQQVFEEAFMQQMQQYKTSGHLTDSRVDAPVVASEKFVDLADIVVDDDTSVLNDFLGSSEPGTESSTQPIIECSPIDLQPDDSNHVVADTGSCGLADANNSSNLTVNDACCLSSNSVKEN